MLFSCREKTDHFLFTEEEENFLPYNLDDSINLIHKADTTVLYVINFMKFETRDIYYSNQIYEVQYVSIENSIKYFIFWDQWKRDNIFQVRIQTFFPQDDNNTFYYTNEPSDYIWHHEQYTINDILYENIIQIRDTSNQSDLYLNSEKGILLLESDIDEYLFN